VSGQARARRPIRPRAAATIRNAAWAAALLIVATLALASARAQAAVVFRDGWMRPVEAGDAAAEAYVDVKADAALAIVGARTDIARRVDFVAAAGTPRPAGRAWRIAPGETLRFARKGNVLALAGVTRSATTGDTVEIVFTFEDAEGRRFDARAPIVVRGLRPPAPN
jgi:copper(I)-binding protein